MPLSRLVARPMTQPDAYRAGRGLYYAWRIRCGGEAAPFCSKPHQHEKSSSSGANGSNRDRCCPAQRAP